MRNGWGHSQYQVQQTSPVEGNGIVSTQDGPLLRKMSLVRRRGVVNFSVLLLFLIECMFVVIVQSMDLISNVIGIIIEQFIILLYHFLAI